MKPKVYVETTIVSYLTATPSSDIILSAHQRLTREWWAGRNRFDLFVSQAVLTEAARGDSVAADRRLVALYEIPVLDIDADVSGLAQRFIALRVIPSKAAMDAMHVAVAVVHGMDYLLTWNCTHIVNAGIRGKIEGICRESRLEPPIICTPEELMES